MKDQKATQVEEQVEEQLLPTYEVPQVDTYTDEEILEELGPAQANVYEVQRTRALVF